MIKLLLLYTLSFGQEKEAIKASTKAVLSYPDVKVFTKGLQKLAPKPLMVIVPVLYKQKISTDMIKLGLDGAILRPVGEWDFKNNTQSVIFKYSLGF